MPYVEVPEEKLTPLQRVLAWTYAHRALVATLIILALITILGFNCDRIFNALFAGKPIPKEAPEK